MKKLFIFSFIGSALPLLIYPGILLANLMTFAAGTVDSESIILLILTEGFLWGSTLYPVVYIASLIAFFKLSSKKSKKLCALIPYAYLVIIFVLFMAWFGVES